MRFSESTGSHNEYVNNILSFSRCYFDGRNKDCPDIESIVNKTSVALNITSFFLLGLIPLTNLGFGLKGSDFQRVYKWFTKSQPGTLKLVFSSDSFKRSQTMSTSNKVEN